MILLKEIFYHINLTLRKSRSQTTSGFGSPMTSQRIVMLSPSKASVDKGFFKNLGSLEYLQEQMSIIVHFDILREKEKM